jgi:FkbM family methyltransferase
MILTFYGAGLLWISGYHFIRSAATNCTAEMPFIFSHRDDPIKPGHGGSDATKRSNICHGILSLPLSPICINAAGHARMSTDLLKLRIAKLATCIGNPTCWHALCLGVAPSIEHRQVLRQLAPDAVIDVGANRGQFAMMCRLLHPQTPIFSFEPIPQEAATFRKVHGSARHVQLLEHALGEVPGVATLHLSQSADSSSLLPIGKNQTDLFSNTAEIGTLDVQVKRLDDLSTLWKGRHRMLLKLDVQGFELAVLKGAPETLDSCAYIYAECSDIALYEGQALREEVEAFLNGHGFHVARRHNEHLRDGKLIQADYLFTRTPV